MLAPQILPDQKKKTTSTARLLAQATAEALHQDPSNAVHGGGCCDERTPGRALLAFREHFLVAVAAFHTGSRERNREAMTASG